MATVNRSLDQRRADSSARRELAGELLALADLVASGRVPAWAVLNVAPSVCMVGQLLRDAADSRQRQRGAGR